MDKYLKAKQVNISYNSVLYEIKDYAKANPEESINAFWKSVGE